MRGHCLVDSGFDRPSTFTRIRHAPLERGKCWVREQRGGGEVQQPGGDHAAAPPDFGNILKVEVVLIMFGIAQRRRFGINSGLLLTDVSGPENAQSFRICGHEPILDSVMHHFDEVSRAAWTAMQITLFCSAAGLLPARRTSGGADTGSECGKDRAEVLNHSRVTANHQTITPFKTSHAATGSH